MSVLHIQCAYLCIIKIIKQLYTQLPERKIYSTSGSCNFLTQFKQQTMKVLKAKMTILGLLSMFLFAGNFVAAQDISPINSGISQPAMQPVENPSSQPYQIATSYAEYQQLFHNKNVNIVRSKQDMRRYIAKEEFLSSKVKGKVLFQFVQAMKFGENGVITFKYGMLKENLSNQEFDLAIEHVFEGLGWNMTASLESGHYMDYYCCGGGTCCPDQGSICISENCK